MKKAAIGILITALLAACPASAMADEPVIDAVPEEILLEEEADSSELNADDLFGAADDSAYEVVFDEAFSETDETVGTGETVETVEAPEELSEDAFIGEEAADAPEELLEESGGEALPDDIFEEEGTSALVGEGEITVNETTFPDENFRNYILANVAGDDGILSAEECGKLEELSVKAMGIHTLKGIEYFPNLTVLNCVENNLTELDLSHNPLLEILMAYDNRLEELDLAGIVGGGVHLLHDGIHLFRIHVQGDPSVLVPARQVLAAAGDEGLVLGGFLCHHAGHVLILELAVAVLVRCDGGGQGQIAVEGPLSLVHQAIGIVQLILRDHVLVEEDGVGTGDHVVGNAVEGLRAKPEHVHHVLVPPFGGQVHIGQVVEVVKHAAGDHLRDALNAVEEAHLIGVVPGLDGLPDGGDHVRDVSAVFLSDFHVDGVLNPDLALEDGVVHAVPGLLHETLLLHREALPRPLLKSAYRQSLQYLRRYPEGSEVYEVSLPVYQYHESHDRMLSP